MQVLVFQMLAPGVVKIHDLIYRYFIGNITNQRVDIVHILLVGRDLPQIARNEVRKTPVMPARIPLCLVDQVSVHA